MVSTTADQRAIWLPFPAGFLLGQKRDDECRSRRVDIALQQGSAPVAGRDYRKVVSVIIASTRNYRRKWTTLLFINRKTTKLQLADSTNS